MADIRNENYIDADRLAEEFLIVNCVWDPADKLWQDGDTVHPALERYLSRSAFEQGYFTLRYWRDTFYIWDAGRYYPVSDSDMKCWIKSFLHSVNQTAQTNRNYADRYVYITAAQIANILLCLAGTQGVYIPERRILNNWVDGSRAEHAQTIAFNNGLLVTDGRGQSPALIKHTPRYFTLTKLPYDYDPDANCPRWREFLLDVMEGDAERIELLCQCNAGYRKENAAAPSSRSWH